MKKTFLKSLSLFLCLLCLVLLCMAPGQISKAETFNKTEAKKKITVTYKKLSDGVLATYKNKNKYPVKLTGTLRFQDSEKKDIQVSKEENLCLEASSSCAIFFPAPYDSNGNYVNYTGYKGSFSVAKSKYKGYSKNISISSDIQTVYSNFSAVNTGKQSLSNIHASIIFYDSEGEILGCRGKNLNCYQKNSMDLFKIDHPLNWGTPAKVKIYINCAY